MLSAMMAEVRSYGEQIIVIDQVPRVSWMSLEYRISKLCIESSTLKTRSRSRAYSVFRRIALPLGLLEAWRRFGRREQAECADDPGFCSTSAPIRCECVDLLRHHCGRGLFSG